MNDLPEFNKKSPRGYRGEASDTKGHKGGRDASAKFASEGNDRRRWTTTIKPDALDQLHAMAKEYKVNRCEVVEALLLHPMAWRVLRGLEGKN
jgi:hypothetical protein